MSSNGETECLTDDEVTQILQWLAPENLVRFRTVCKSWLSMITTSAFIAEHQQRNAENGRIIILKEPTFTHPRSRATFQFQILSDNLNPGPRSADRNVGRIQTLPIWRRGNKHWHVHGTCNGFFCGTARSMTHLVNPSTVYLCNPSIRWATVVPDYPCEFIYPTNRRAAYDSYGVGFDSSERDFKILKMRIARSCYAQAAIFSFKSRTWKRLECRVRNRDIPGRSVFAHGSIHWISIYRNAKDKHTTSIMSFNIHDQVFREIQLPNSNRYGRHITASVHVMGGSLRVMMVEMRGTWACQVWRMKEYGVVESWEEEFRVELPLQIQCMEVSAGGKLVCRSNGMMARNGNLVHVNYERSSVRRRRTLYQLILYDPKTHHYTNISQTARSTQIFIDGSFDFPDCH